MPLKLLFDCCDACHRTLDAVFRHAQTISTTARALTTYSKCINASRHLFQADHNVDAHDIMNQSRVL